MGDCQNLAKVTLNKRTRGSSFLQTQSSYYRRPSMICPDCLGWLTHSSLDPSSCPLWRWPWPLSSLVIRNFPDHHSFSRMTVSGFKVTSAHVTLSIPRCILSGPWTCVCPVDLNTLTVCKFITLFLSSCLSTTMVLHFPRLCHQTKRPGWCWEQILPVKTMAKTALTISASWMSIWD